MLGKRLFLMMLTSSLLSHALLPAESLPAAVAPTATQIVTMAVSAISQIAITGAAPTLTINSVSGGILSTSSTGITYSITTNERNKKITGSIDTTMPANTTLSVNLAAPSTAVSAGNVNLSTTAADLVTSISTLVSAGLPLTYTFSATPSAGTISSFTRTVTFTVVDGS